MLEKKKKKITVMLIFGSGFCDNYVAYDLVIFKYFSGKLSETYNA